MKTLVRKRARPIRAAFILLALACVTAWGQVPSEYVDLYNSMQGAIASFNNGTLALWDGSKPPVNFGGHVASANSNNGANLLTPTAYQAVLIELNGLKAVGVAAVVFDIGYPTLDPNFDAWGGQSDAYLSFYQQAVAAARGLGLKVIVETKANFTTSVLGNVNCLPYFQSLTTAAYMTGRAQEALLIAQQLQPDYLNVMEEPDTESAQSGKPELYTYTGSMQMLNTILSTLRGAHVSMPLGAGVGTWLGTDSQGKNVYDYISGYASTSIDAIDMHVYPVVNDYLSRMNVIASLAQMSGKKITISEAWDYKERVSEVGNPAFTSDMIYSRDVFSFWAPVDAQFLQAMVNFSYFQKLDFMAAFWTGYLRGYLTYDGSTSTLPPAELFSEVQTLQGQQELAGAYTTTGLAWENFILAAPDTTPPGAPVVTASSVYPNQVVLSWTWPTDNVGVSRFAVTGSGSLLTMTALTAYSDTGLLDGKTYSYTVTAYDAKNNKTASQPLTVTTPDITPPTPPTMVKATLSASDSIKLTWSGATDNVRVSGYKLYRGVNGTPPAGFASLGNVTTYTNANLQSSTSYCYYLLAQDPTGNVSAPSATACATTPDTRPPTVPTGVSASGTAPPVITIAWTASTDAVGVAGYNLQRSVNGGASTPLVKGITGTSYMDTSAMLLADTAPPSSSVSAPAAGSTNSGTITFSGRVYDVGTRTTYTYQADAFDASGNTSAWSYPGVVTWPVNTSGIAGVRFLVDGMDITPEVTVPPYYVRWNTTGVPNGSHTLTVIARDAAGNTTTSAPVVITVQN